MLTAEDVDKIVSEKFAPDIKKLASEIEAMLMTSLHCGQSEHVSLRNMVKRGCGK
jgi:hypothetical protein